MEKRKTNKMVLLIILLVVSAAIFFIGRFFLSNSTYYSKMLNRIDKAGFVEHQATLPDGSILNYGEGPDNGAALFLIHGQGVDWKNYGRNLPELSKYFHVFAIDCYGHGNSSKDPQKYSAHEMGTDFIWFINNIIKEPVYISGHSSGGLLAAWVAAHEESMILGAVLEDPPYFSSEDGRKELAYNYHDISTVCYQFLNQQEVNDFPLYYFLNQRAWKFFPEGADEGLKNFAIQYREKNPNSYINIPFLPPTLMNIMPPIENYDPRFGLSFYDGSFNRNYNHAEVLDKITSQTILIHANWSYDDSNILNGAMDGDDAERAAELIDSCELVNIESGHNVHFEHIKFFNNTLIEMARSE